MARMKFLLIFLPFLTHCEPYNKVPEVPIKAKLLVTNENGIGTSYREVSFKTLKNPRKMEGGYGSYLVQSIVNVVRVIDVIIESPEKLFISQGESPNLRYKLEDGVIIPLSKEAHFMLTNYYHLEHIIDFWKENGLDFTDVKYRLYFEPINRVTGGTQEDIPLLSLGNFTIDHRLKMNAAFLPYSLPGTRSFFVLRNSKLEDLPISHNLTIWAHEFGHNMFDKAFTVRDHTVYQEAEDSQKAHYLLSGLNEGCADYFAATLTDSNLSELSDSFSVDLERTLPVAFNSSDIKEGASHYKWGSVFASALYEIAQTEGKMTVAKQLYSALGKLRLDWESVQRGDDFNFHFIAKRMIDEGASRGKKDLYCRYFESRFNDELNLPKIQNYCQ